IGTAKPTVAERTEVRHHGIDLVTPSEPFTVADFQQMANEALGTISSRGGAPVLVAGTGLYLSALVNHLELPGSWPEVRIRLEHEALNNLDAMFRRLETVDPVAASKMEPTNARRIVRALEVCEGSGRTFSSFGPGLETYPQSEISQVGLRWTRERLAARIKGRVHRMMEQGLFGEVERLAGSGEFSRTARQALGYKELLDVMDGLCSLDEAVETIIVRTRQFAVRQDRWFRRDPRIRWIDIEMDSLEALPVLAGAVIA
ncbi:MAG: tRNA (adenosine(37)-N6)-dimethylallyltransferase MiaA, partial [Actinomycetota bacterium]